ncbi:MAG: hypothetical protein IIV13_05710 [Bacteroidaceae bacterium]|nr:hypothetical protein [Bacteroidaceae bacterium]
MRKLLLTLAVLCGTVSGWAEGLSDGVYIIENVINKRGTICAADGINNVALTGITLSGYENNSQTSVENGEKWYVFTLFGKTYLYNLGNNKFVADKSGNYAVYSDNVPSAGMQIEKNGEYYVFKSNSHNLSCCLGYAEMVRWLSDTEAASQHFTVSPVANGTTTFAAAIATARAKVAESNKITNVENLDNTKAYYLRSKRGALLYNSANPNQLSSTVAYGNISNTSSAAEWAIILKNDKYYFYSLEGKKFIGKNADEAGRYPMQVLPQNDVQIVSSTVNDYPFVFSTDNYGAINHLNHPTAPGVANWKGDGNSGGLKSLGDDGSVHQIMAVRDLTDEEIQDIEYAFTLTNPKTGTEYVLYDAAHKVFLDINNLATAPQQAVCTELATLNSEKQSLYITAEGLSWKIHTATGKYLGQYTDANQWNSKVNEDQSEFAWTSNPVLENGNIFIMLQNTSGKQNGFLGNEGHANGSALFVNQTDENRKLKLKLHEASLVYKVVLNVTSGAIVYNGKNYANGEYILAQEAITAEDLTVKRVPGKEATYELNEETKTITVTYAHGVNFTAGDKIFIRNKENANDYLYVEFSGGKLDNSVAPSTKKINHLTKNGSNINHKFCWELKAATHNDEECFYLYNPYYDWYAGSLIATNSNALLSKTVADAGKYKIETEGDYFVIHCLTSNITGGTNRNFVHWYGWLGGGVVGWERDSDASQWQVEEVTEDIEAQWQSNLTSQFNTLTKYQNVLGDGASQYSGMPEEMIDGFNALTLPEEASAIEKARYSVYALYEYGSAVDALTLNMPPAGFYRIKSTNSVNDSRNGQYVQNYVNGDGLTLNRDTDARSIMYFCNNNLLSYASGKYLNGYNGKDLIGEVGTTPTTWTIEENTNAVASYALSVPSGGYMSDWGDGSKTSSGQKSTYETWTFESVETLPVTITSAGYATFYCPVAVTLPVEGLKAYYVSSTENGKAQMTEIEKVIPANTGVILEGAEGPYNLTIAGEAESVTNKLSGTVASEYISTPSYVLSAQGTPAVVGFYQAKLNFTVADNGTGAKVTEGGTHFLNNGFKAYLPANAVTTADARFLVFDFGGTETSIDELKGENGNVKAEVYDLAGRRVLNAKKGVFVVNGKVIVK